MSYTATDLGRRKDDYVSVNSLRRSFYIGYIHHFFDYLRQALMCSADSTLEARNESIGGVTGWEQRINVVTSEVCSSGPKATDTVTKTEYQGIIM